MVNKTIFSPITTATSAHNRRRLLYYIILYINNFPTKYLAHATATHTQTCTVRHAAAAATTTFVCVRCVAFARTDFPRTDESPLCCSVKNRI